MPRQLRWRGGGAGRIGVRCERNTRLLYLNKLKKVEQFKMQIKRGSGLLNARFAEKAHNVGGKTCFVVSAGAGGGGGAINSEYNSAAVVETWRNAFPLCRFLLASVVADSILLHCECQFATVCVQKTIEKLRSIAFTEAHSIRIPSRIIGSKENFVFTRISAACIVLRYRIAMRDLLH